MPRQLQATVTFDIADDTEAPEWRVNQDLLEQLVVFATTISHEHLVGDPQVRKVIPAKTKGTTE